MARTQVAYYQASLKALVTERKAAKKLRKRGKGPTTAERKIMARITKVQQACTRAACVLIAVNGWDLKEALKETGVIGGS